MPSRRTGLAGVFAAAVSAGTMASSNGRATAVPIPRRNIRRDKAIFVMNMPLLSTFHFSIFHLSRLTHLKRRTFDDRQNRRRPAIVVGCRRAHDGSDGWRVEVFHLTADGIGEQLASY